MIDLVTIADARAQLRIDDWMDDDAWLEIWIPTVSHAVASWLKDEWRLYVVERDSDGAVVLDSDDVPVSAIDSNGDRIINPLVRAAVLVELASQYRFREGEGKDNVVTADAGHGYTLNKTSTALLAGMRLPTVA